MWILMIMKVTFRNHFWCDFSQLLFATYGFLPLETVCDSFFLVPLFTTFILFQVKVSQCTRQCLVKKTLLVLKKSYQKLRKVAPNIVAKNRTKNGFKKSGCTNLHKKISKFAVVPKIRTKNGRRTILIPDGISVQSLERTDIDDQKSTIFSHHLIWNLSVFSQSTACISLCKGVEHRKVAPSCQI